MSLLQASSFSIYDPYEKTQPENEIMLLGVTYEIANQIEKDLSSQYLIHRPLRPRLLQRAPFIFHHQNLHSFSLSRTHIPLSLLLPIPPRRTCWHECSRNRRKTIIRVRRQPSRHAPHRGETRMPRESSRPGSRRRRVRAGRRHRRRRIF